MYAIAHFPTKYRLDVREAMLNMVKLRKAYTEMQSDIENSIQYMIDANNAMDRLEKYNAVVYDETAMQKKLDQGFTIIPPQNIDWAKDYVKYSKLSPVAKRKMLRKMQQKIAVKDMSYSQAKLFHRLKGRIK